MSFRILSLIGAIVLATPAVADIEITDAYARSTGPMARAGAAFMVINNTGTEDDRLIAATSDVAMRVELHTHKDMGGGVMSMVEVKEGFPVAAGGMHMLARGGDHVMFMGLNGAWQQGDMLNVTLTFEKAGDLAVQIPVDLERAEAPMDGTGLQHGKVSN